MTEQPHIPAEDLAAYATADRTPEQARRVEEHTAVCDECAGRLRSILSFIQNLDDAWNRDRLQAMGINHPSAAELDALWLNEAQGAHRASLLAHVEDCGACTAHLAQLEEGFAALQKADPLNRPSWSSAVRRKFAAGIEMAVDAANGVYTSAAGMARDVMTPQATASLAPAPAVSMGSSAPAPPDGLVWHDAFFQTDEVSGEVTGSTDAATGRGVVTVTVNKSGGFVAEPPIVDLVSVDGETVGTQSGLDIGDRYTANFSNLDQGHYLIGIREPGE
jgi:hypothetical protein